MVTPGDGDGDRIKRGIIDNDPEVLEKVLKNPEAQRILTEIVEQISREVRKAADQRFFSQPLFPPMILKSMGRTSGLGAPLSPVGPRFTEEDELRLRGFSDDEVEAIMVARKETLGEIAKKITKKHALFAPLHSDFRLNVRPRQFMTETEEKILAESGRVLKAHFLKIEQKIPEKPSKADHEKMRAALEVLEAGDQEEALRLCQEMDDLAGTIKYFSWMLGNKKGGGF